MRVFQNLRIHFFIKLLILKTKSFNKTVLCLPRKYKRCLPMSVLMDKGNCARYKVYFGVSLTYHLKYPVLKLKKGYRFHILLHRMYII